MNQALVSQQEMSFEVPPVQMTSHMVPQSQRVLTPIHGKATAAPGTASKDELVKAHLGLVRWAAHQLQAKLPPHIELDELIAAGMLGLVDAAARFDGSRDAQFKTFAQFRVRGAMTDALRSLDAGSRQLRRQGREVAEATHALRTRQSQEPTEAEVAAEMGISDRTYHAILQQLHSLQPQPASSCLEDDQDETESLPAPAKENPLQRCLDREQLQALGAAIETLPEKERLVLSLYYYEELTMKEIAQVLGVVESRVSQLHAAALKRLRLQFGATKVANKTR